MSFVTNKTLILTGASSGVGRALALDLARAGARLVLNARGEGPLRETLAACEAASDGPHALVAGSAADMATATALAEAALKLGDFGGFIHCAGTLHPGPTLWEMPETDFDSVFAAATTAAHRLARACMPHLLERGEGLAVIVGSPAADMILPGIAAYCGAKAGLEHLTRLLADEAPEITTFVYRPGIVDTPMQTQARESEGGAAERLQSIFKPWKEKGHLLTPEQSAAALAAILTIDPRRFHGLTATVKDGRTLAAEAQA